MAVALPADDVDRYVGVPEAAVRLGVSTRTAYRLIERGEFPVPTATVAGKTKVSLRRLAEHMAQAAA